MKIEQLVKAKWFAPDSLSKSFSLKLKKWLVLPEAQQEQFSHYSPSAHFIQPSKDPTVTGAHDAGWRHLDCWRQ